MATPRAAVPAALLVLAGGLAAQITALSPNYRELSFSRNRSTNYSELLLIRGGLGGQVAAGEDKDVGKESDFVPDGQAWLHTEGFGAKTSALDAYAGRDGVYAGIREGDIVGDGNIGRLELTGRFFPFYREGFYRDDSFISTGRYEGKDYGAALSVGRLLRDDASLEVGAFYRWYKFERNEQTPANYVIPDDHETYGGQAWFEQRTLQFNRQTGRPEQGYLATIGAVAEWNTSKQRFGIPGNYESQLPELVYRGRARLEWYFPQGQDNTWEFILDGSLSDSQDRVFNYDATKPVGHTYVDADLRYRLELGGGIYLAPMLKLEFIRILEQTGAGTQNKFFYGGGLYGGMDFSDALGLVLSYSYLNNESRPSPSWNEDLYGEHQFFIGVELRLMATQR